MSFPRFAPAALVAASALAPFLLDCSSGDPPSASGDAGREGSAPSTYKPQLRFTYSAEDATIYVHVATSLKTDTSTKAVVRVRRGTLALGGEAALDCKALAQAGVVVDLANGTPENGEKRYVGPDVDASILAQFYEDEVIGPDATDEQLAGIAAGTDPIVEGCVMKGDTVLARAQMSVFRAWDEAIPDLVDRALAYEKGQGQRPAWHSVATYGQLCERELGDNPLFPKKADGTYETYDCVGGPHQITVPITVTDGAGTPQAPTTEPARCDRPDWLRGSCAPYTHVGRVENAQGTRWVVICRKPPPSGHGPTSTKFNDIGLIGHNPKTGKTCFFQNALYGKTDAAHVTNPADPKNAEATWSSFIVETCNHCHDNDAFAHSPWIDQVKYPDGHYVVPRIDDDPDFTRDPKRPFSLVGMRTKGWKMKPAVVSPEAAACTSCHRIAFGNTVTAEETTFSFTDRSVGADLDHNKKLTPAFTAFPRSHWMPPELGGMSQSAFDQSAYGRAIAFLKKCQGKPTDSSCKYEDIPR